MSEPELKPLDKIDVTFVETWDEAQDLLEWLGHRREFLGIDLETEGTNVGRDRIRLAQFGDSTHAWAMEWAEWRGLVRTVIDRYSRPIVAHNLLFESRFLKREGIPLKQHLSHDSMVMAHIWDPRFAISLEARGSRHVDRRSFVGKRALSEAFSAGKWDWRTIPIDHPSYWIYGALDASLGALIAEELWPKIQPWRRVYDVELGCIHVLRDAGLAGMLIDVDYCHDEVKRLSGVRDECIQQMPIDPGKDKEIIGWLKDRGVKDGWPWPEWPRTEKKNLSVDDDALKYLEPTFPEFIAPLRKWRKADRLVNSYFLNFIDMQVNSVLYPSVKPLGARTGRMSVTEPALQTLPKGSVVRNAFISRPGSTLILSDYEQMELRVLASKAQETAMIEAFSRGEDMHAWVGMQAYETDKLTSWQRDIAKHVQFARIYGAGNAKIAVTAGVEVEVIEEFMLRYDELFPGVSRYMASATYAVRERTFHDEEKTGWVETVLGRRLPVEKDKAYKGVNYEIQSSATGDVLKLKLIELSNAGLGPFIRLPVHDEIVFEAPDDELEDAIATIKDVMPEHELFAAPLTIDVETTRRWGSKYEGFD